MYVIRHGATGRLCQRYSCCLKFDRRGTMKLNCQRTIFLWQILLETSVFVLGQDCRPDFRPRCSSLTSAADDVIQLHKKVLPSDVSAFLPQPLSPKNHKCLSQEYCSLPACSLHPCLNGGTCMEIRTGYICRCLQGYHGDNCEYVDVNNTSNIRSSATTTLPTDTSEITTVRHVREVAGNSTVATKLIPSLIPSSGHSTTKDGVSKAADITTKAATAPLTETSWITVGESTGTTELTTEQITSVTPPSSEKSRPTTRGITSATDENDIVTTNDTVTTLVASIPPTGTSQTATVIETTSDVATEQKTSQTPSSAQVSTQDVENTITSVVTTKTASTPPSETLQSSTVTESSKTAEPETEQLTSLRLTSASIQPATDEVHDTTTSILSTEAAATTGTSQTTVTETTSTADTTTEQQTSLMVVKGATTLAAVDSCVDRCWFDSSKPCQCNSQCQTYGDCCADYVTACQGVSNSCSSRCGHGYDPANPCQCNAQCSTYNNCCSDYDSLC